MRNGKHRKNQKYILKKVLMVIMSEKENLNKTKSGIPQNEIEKIARHFLPQIREFFSTEEGRKEYEKWKAQQNIQSDN